MSKTATEISYRTVKEGRENQCTTADTEDEAVTVEE